MNIKEIINKDNIKKIVNLLFAILSVGGIAYYLILGTAEHSVNNIIYIPLIYVFYRLYKEIRINKRIMIFSIILALFTSVVLIIGTQLEKDSDAYWSIVTLIKICLLAIALTPIYNKVIDVIDNKVIGEDSENRKISKKSFFIVYGILFFFGLLGFLALFPGEYGYDAGFQMMQIQFDDVTITTHFSVLYSFILYGFVNLGNTLFHSYNAGFAMYTFFQMCVITYVATRVTLFTYKLTGNKIIFVLTTIFFCIFPLHIIMMLSAAQDTIFCGLLTLIFMDAYDLVFDSAEFWKSVRRPISLALLGLLLCIFRNNGMYILLFAIVMTIFFVKKYKFRTIAIYIVSIALFMIYKGPIFNALKVDEGDTLREMSSIPCQQLARVYTYNKDVYSEEDLELLDKIFGYRQENLFEYYYFRQSISDSIKATINEDFVKENPDKVMNLYLKTMVNDPQNYAEGFLLNSIGFWYPNKNYPDERIYHPFIEFEMMDGKYWNERYIDLDRQSLFPLYYKLLDILVNRNGCHKIPILSSFFTCGTYFLLCIFVGLWAIYKKKYKLLYPMTILLGYFGTLLLSPVCIFRYCYALILCAPIIFSFCFIKGQTEAIEKLEKKVNDK